MEKPAKWHTDSAQAEAIAIPSSSAMRERRPFFTQVESLRGLGAMAIAAYHISGWRLHNQQLLPHLPWGSLVDVQQVIGRVILALIPAHGALMMFFVISGLVLRVSLEYGPQDFWPAAVRFHVARLFRIYPAVIVATLLAVAVQGWQVPPNPSGIVKPLTPGLLLANCLLLDTSVNGALWALQVELLMAPIIVLLYFLEKRFGIRPVAGIALLATMLSFTKRWALFPPLSHNFFAFVLGMLLPTIGRPIVLTCSRSTAQRWTVASLVMLFLPAAVFGIFSRFTAVIEAYAAAVLVSMVTYRCDLAGVRLLNVKPLRLLGLCSGSYYVLHMVTIAPAILIGTMLFPAEWSARAPALTGSLFIALWLIAISPLMLLSYHLVEAPGIALGRYVMGRKRSKIAPAEPESVGIP